MEIKGGSEFLPDQFRSDDCLALRLKQKAASGLKGKKNLADEESDKGIESSEKEHKYQGEEECIFHCFYHKILQ